MKIGIITSPFCSLPPDAIGAVEKLWFDMSLVFAKKGHAVQIIGKRDKVLLPDEMNIIRTYVKGFSRTKSIYSDIVLDFLYSIRALRQLHKCDVLVCNTFWTPILAPFFFRRKYEKLVYNVARFPKWHMRLYTRVDLFACTSKAVRSALLKVLPNDMGSRSVVVSNPIDTDVFGARGDATKGVPALIGYHGRINKEKGLDLLAKAVSLCADEFPGIRLRMIGSWDVGKGGSGDRYKECLDRLSGGRIDWMGPMSNKRDLAFSLSECHVYCYPSVAENGETFGVSPLEAMGLGLPVIVSSLECFADFVEDGVTGVVFDHRRKDACSLLVEKIKCCLSNDNVCRSIGSEAAVCAKRFSTDNIAGEYIKAFDNILSNKRQSFEEVWK